MTHNHRSMKEIEKLQIISQQTRGNIIQNILGHYRMMPSFEEIAYYNPNKGKSTISEHIDTLLDAGIVEQQTLPAGKRESHLPSTFYTLTDEGYDLLGRHSLFFPQLGEIRSDHARVRKTEKIRRFERAPRPIDFEYGFVEDG